jgi:uncharacterized membrane protein YdbT with pleckstrin-like domain
MEAKRFTPFAQILPFVTLDVFPDRVILRKGLFGKTEESAPMSKITDVGLTQGFLGGLFGVGDLSIQTAGSDEAEMTIKRLGKARIARDLLLDYIAKAESKKPT